MLDWTYFYLTKYKDNYEILKIFSCLVIKKIETKIQKSISEFDR